MITYRLPVHTEKQMAHAERRQREAYTNYNSVVVENDGIDYIKIVCTKPIGKKGIDLVLG